MKKIVCLIISVSFLFVTNVFGRTITVNYPIDNTTATAHFRGATMDYFDDTYDELLTPATVTIDGKDYQALCLDFANIPIQEGEHEVTFSNSATFSNSNYVDPINSLGFALYSLAVNWDETRDFAFVQVMLFDTLYDFQPDQNMHLDRNFMVWDVINPDFDDVTLDVQYYQTPYQTFLTNSRSNKSFSTVGIYEQFTVISFNESGDYRHLLVKGVITNDAVTKTTETTCEPIILEVEKIVYQDRTIEVLVEKIVYVDKEVIVYQDRTVEVPVEKIVYVDKEVIVYVDKVKETKKQKRKRNRERKRVKKGNNGHGNDTDHNDNSNPGKSNDPNDNTDDDGSPNNKTCKR